MGEPLLMELHVEVFTPVLDTHPFFHRYGELNPGVRKVCHTAISQAVLSHGDLLYAAQDTADQMYFVKSGKLNYNPVGDHSVIEKVDVGEWLCEACLWTTWETRGEVLGCK